MEYDYCPTLGTPYLYSDDLKPKTRTIFKARCKQWTCPYCSIVNKHQHFIRILNGINILQDRGVEFNFVTLTSHEALPDLISTYRIWSSAWKKLRQRIVRHEYHAETGVFYYVYIPETHRDGRLHIHGIFSGNIRTRWYKDNARQCGLGYQAKSVNIENAFQGANYCLKYITKNIGKQIDIPRFRRINYSQQFPDKPLPETLGTWSIAKANESIVELIEDAWRKDLNVNMHGKEILEILTT